MITILTIPLILILIIFSLWYDYFVWISLAILSIFMHINVLSMKTINKNLNIKNIHDLSADAAEMANEYGHFYTHPFASKDYAGICALNQFTGILIACINAYHGIYWTIFFAVINWYSLAYAAHFFNPLIRFEQSNKLHVHQEILDHLRSSE